MTDSSHPKVAIIGAGTVGSTTAYACLIRGITRHLVLYDVNGARARAETLDLEHGLQFVTNAVVEGGDDLELVRDAAVIVVTAGAKSEYGQTRLDLAASNVALCRELVPRLVEVAPAAILLFVTNPVDILTYAALKISGLPRERVIGSGTVLDSSRLRFLLAQHCRVAIQSVHAFVVGEHGDSELPLWSTASIGTVPLLSWDTAGHGRLTAEDRERIAREVAQVGYQILKGKGATNYAIGLTVTSILEAILGDENRVMPVTSLLNDFHGIGDVCLSVPCIVSREGASEPLPVPISDGEIEALRASAETLRQVARRFGV